MRFRLPNRFLHASAIAAGVAGAAMAQSTVNVVADISGSVTWTSNNVYNLTRQIYVQPGATLVIQAGTVVASATGIGGSLAVAKGAQIFVQGTETNPVVMTSSADRATWTANNPRTGTYRQACNEWGNLTIMGAGYVSENVPGGATPNSATPNANNVAAMEGLVANPLYPGRTLYGGGNDDDDSGSVQYLSLRYGGRVIGLGNELNGMSLGGIGRETDIHHIEIMNNVDDGIEVWGGTVNLKYLSIWNIGDDSLDIDQGWRGKAQFGLIVQGYSIDNGQGGGFGDNCLETDGAEDSDWQPVTTAVIENFTVIGNPSDGDRLTAWRDNARVQYHRCIFMDGGEELVGFDNVDGDGGNGYGWHGTLDWPTTWATPYTQASTVNAPANPLAFYRSQTSGKLAEMRDCVFFNNTKSNAYTMADTLGVRDASNDNVTATLAPITSVTRAPEVLLPNTNKRIRTVTFLDPRPANDALTSVSWAPDDGFFDSARYRGAFGPGNTWLSGWTASDAFGFTSPSAWFDLGRSTVGSSGAPVLTGVGSLAPNTPFALNITNAAPNTGAAFIFSILQGSTTIFGVDLVPDLNFSVIIGIPTNASGQSTVALTLPPGLTGARFYWQSMVFDPSVANGWSGTNALECTAQ